MTNNWSSLPINLITINYYYIVWTESGILYQWVIIFTNWCSIGVILFKLDLLALSCGEDGNNIDWLHLRSQHEACSAGCLDQFMCR